MTWLIVVLAWWAVAIIVGLGIAAGVHHAEHMAGRCTCRRSYRRRGRS